jgi:hypothetical protein
MRIISSGQAIPEIKWFLRHTNPFEVQVAYDMIRAQNIHTLLKLNLDAEINTFNDAMYEAKNLIKDRIFILTN